MWNCHVRKRYFSSRSKAMLFVAFKSEGLIPRWGPRLDAAGARLLLHGRGNALTLRGLPARAWTPLVPDCFCSAGNTLCIWSSFCVAGAALSVATFACRSAIAGCTCKIAGKASAPYYGSLSGIHPVVPQQISLRTDCKTDITK